MVTEDLDLVEEARMDAAAAFARAVAHEAHRLRVREAARAKVAAEDRPIDLPAPTRLDEFLRVRDEDAAYRVDRLWPMGGRVVLSAPHKAGKTTLVGNLIRSLVDGQPFLDAFDVVPPGRVLLIDNELDERMLRRWLRDQRITATRAVQLLPLRGRLSSFDILDPAIRTLWADRLRGADVLIFDCLRPALDALGLSEDKDAGRFLEALDELATEAGVSETFVVHHMGHNGERSRGDSRILDWPDAIWKLVKSEDDDDDRPLRYFTAYGRDVDQGEQLLHFDRAARRLTVAGGSRKEARTEALTVQVLGHVKDNDGCTQTAIERAVGGRAEHVRAALRRLVEEGRIDRERDGQRFLHHLSASTRPTTSGRVDVYRVPASIDADADAVARTHRPDRDADAVTTLTREPTP